MQMANSIQKQTNTRISFKKKKAEVIWQNELLDSTLFNLPTN